MAGDGVQMVQKRFVFFKQHLASAFQLNTGAVL